MKVRFITLLSLNKINGPPALTLLPRRRAGEAAVGVWGGGEGHQEALSCQEGFERQWWLGETLGRLRISRCRVFPNTVFRNTVEVEAQFVFLHNFLYFTRTPPTTASHQWPVFKLWKLGVFISQKSKKYSEAWKPYPAQSPAFLSLY